MGLDAVLFDWGGTLTPWHTFDPLDVWRACARGLDGLVEAEVEQAAARLLAAEDEFWSRCDGGRASATLDAVFAAAGVVPCAAAVEAMYAAMEPHTYTDPEAVPVLRALRDDGLRVGVLSNTLWPRELHERIFTRDNVLDLLDGAVYSSEIPHTKPHPAAFRAALDAVGVDDPTRAVFVGDRLYDDIHGAAQVGMRTILIPHSVLPAGQIVAVDTEPDAVAQRLTDVVDIVGDWI